MSDTLTLVEARESQNQKATIKGLQSARPFRGPVDGDRKGGRQAVRVALRTAAWGDADDEQEDPDAA